MRKKAEERKPRGKNCLSGSVGYESGMELGRFFLKN